MPGFDDAVWDAAVEAIEAWWEEERVRREEEEEEEDVTRRRRRRRLRCDTVNQHTARRAGA